MSRKTVMQVVLIVTGVLILIGVTLMAWMLKTEDERNNINVDLSDGKTIKFENLDLVPGESCEYVIKLKGENAKKYKLSLDFVDTDEEKTLKKFVRVKITVGGKTLYDELLADAFENEDITLRVDFKTGKNTKLKIVYYLPVEVGNEAKNAEAVFELRLTASNE